MIARLAQTGHREADDIARAIERVQARQSGGKSLLEQFAEWAGELFGNDVTPTALKIVYWIVVVALVVLTFEFLRRHAVGVYLGGSSHEASGSTGGPTLGERIAVLRREAREARARGDARTALRNQFFALVLGFGGRGDIEFRDAWTVRELLRRGKPSPEAQGLLGKLVGELEAKDFGGESIRDADLDRLEELCERYLGGLA